jgi:hypothetical protein
MISPSSATSAAFFVKKAVIRMKFLKILIVSVAFCGFLINKTAPNHAKHISTVIVAHNRRFLRENGRKIFSTSWFSKACQTLHDVAKVGQRGVFLLHANVI